MLQPSIMAEALAEHWQGSGPRSLLDVGSGDGTFMLRVARRLAARWPDVTVTLLDQQNIVSGSTRKAFAALGWKAEPVHADVFEISGASASKSRRPHRQLGSSSLLTRTIDTSAVPGSTIDATSRGLPAPTLPVRAANQPSALADRMQRSSARGRDSKRARGISGKGTFRIVANARSLGTPRRCSKAIHALSRGSAS